MAREDSPALCAQSQCPPDTPIAQHVEAAHTETVSICSWGSRKALGGQVSAVAMALVGNASPASAKDTGFEIGGRAGLGFPFGNRQDADQSNLSYAVTATFPLQLDLGYRLIPRLMLGGYAQYGPGFTATDACTKLGVDAKCDAQDVRVGIDAQFHFAPHGKVDPWLGPGIGYEWLILTTEFAGQRTETSSTGKGLEFLSVQGGLDFSRWGPFFAVSFGEFSSYSGSCSGQCAGVVPKSGNINDKALHEWLVIGARGSFIL